MGKLFTIIFITFIQLIWVIRADVSLQKIETSNGTGAAGLYAIKELKAGKFNRTAFVLNTQFETFIDLDESFTVGEISFQIQFNFYKNKNSVFQVKADVYFSRMGNNQFMRSPLRYAEQNFCQGAEKFYKNYMKNLKDNSNFPQYGPDEKVCPFKKGKYYAKNVLLDINKIRIPSGLWRLDLTIKRLRSVFLIVQVTIKSDSRYGK